MKLRVEDLTVKYGDTIAIENVSFEIEEPGLVQILGPNGAGKSTLLRAIAGLIKPTRGCVCIDGEDVTGNVEKIGKRVGYVPQRPPIAKHSPITVKELICYSLLFRKRRWPRGRCSFSIENVLEKVQLPAELQDRKLEELSGGQLMKAFIARALLNEPELLLLDEPLGPVDPSSKVELSTVMGELGRKRMLLVTSHDPMILLPFTSKIILLNKILVAFGDPREVLTEKYVSQVYGKAYRVVESHVHIFDSHWQ